MTIPFTTDSILAVVAAPFVGSFLALLIVRLPEGRGVVVGRSACPACGHALAAIDLVPVLSWLARRGRCRHCGARVSTLYPVVELGALGIAVWAATETSGWVLAATCVLGWTLLALAVIDWRHEVLPDALTLPLVGLGLVVAYALAADGFVDHVIGAAAGFVAFVVVRWLYGRLRGREGLGLGDAKLLAGAGAWLSWAGLGSVVLIAAATALSVTLASGAAGRRLRPETRLPFGPFLALGTWFVWLYGPILIGS